MFQIEMKRRYKSKIQLEQYLPFVKTSKKQRKRTHSQRWNVDNKISVKKILPQAWQVTPINNVIFIEVQPLVHRYSLHHSVI